MSQNVLKPSTVPDVLSRADAIQELDDQSYSILAMLTPLQQKILIAMVDNIGSETTLTDGQIAKNVGATQQYVRKLRRNPKFCDALGVCVKAFMRGTQDAAVSQLIKHAKNNVKATEVWLEIGETYEKKQRNINVNANLNANLSPSTTNVDIIQQFLAQLLDLGWSPERIREEAIAVQRGG